MFKFDRFFSEVFKIPNLGGKSCATSYDKIFYAAVNSFFFFCKKVTFYEKCLYQNMQFFNGKINFSRLFYVCFEFYTAYHVNEWGSFFYIFFSLQLHYNAWILRKKFICKKCENVGKHYIGLDYKIGVFTDFFDKKK